MTLCALGQDKGHGKWWVCEGWVGSGGQGPEEGWAWPEQRARPWWSGEAGVKEVEYVGWRGGRRGPRGPAHHTKGRGHRPAQAMRPGALEGFPGEG